MNKKDFLDHYTDYEDRILVNRLIQMASQSVREYTFKCTDFLDPREQRIAESVLHLYREADYFLEGITVNGERKICVVHHPDLERSEMDLPIEILQVDWTIRDKKPSHRDILGSLMGSGIKRETLGDIILEELKAFVVCDRSIAQYLVYNLTRIGNTPVNVSIAEVLEHAEEKTKEIVTTVASLRLDCIIGAGFGLSRSKAADSIKAGRVKVNWEEIDTPGREVHQGDMISLRGGGRITIDQIMGTTKKDRIKLTIKKYV